MGGFVEGCECTKMLRRTKLVMDVDTDAQRENKLFLQVLEPLGNRVVCSSFCQTGRCTQVDDDDGRMCRRVLNLIRGRRLVMQAKWHTNVSHVVSFS
jgi:hypothetical protein